MPKIYTIGYEGKDIRDFIQLLKENSIETVIDVRSYPTSKRENFDKESLKEKLGNENIGYRHYPELGGLTDQDYKEKVKTESWKMVFGKLKSTASKHRSAMMCLEKDPMRCHRRFIAEKLGQEGWAVTHIKSDGLWKGKRLDDF